MMSRAGKVRVGCVRCWFSLLQCEILLFRGVDKQQCPYPLWSIPRGIVLHCLASDKKCLSCTSHGSPQRLQSRKWPLRKAPATSPEARRIWTIKGSSPSKKSVILRRAQKPAKWRFCQASKFSVIQGHSTLRTPVIEAQRPLSTSRQGWIAWQIYWVLSCVPAVYQCRGGESPGPRGLPAEEIIECNPIGPLCSRTENTV